jgi:unsaturated rhamnogalacturonyl hydrolase
MSEQVIVNDPKGVGAFLMASNEMNIADHQAAGKGKTVLLDSYFNNETKKDSTGQTISWHYKWDELSNGGFSLWGNVFRSYGARTETLNSAPLNSRVAYYIIVDPDTRPNLRTNYVQSNDVKAIADRSKPVGGLS